MRIGCDQRDISSGCEMAGWDKAPEYGGSGTWLTNTLAIIAMAAAVSLAFWPHAAAADPCTAELPTTAGAEFSGVVRYVGDGDSICVGPANSGGATWIEVRIMDFNAPEMSEAGGANARRILRRLVLNREAQCVVTPGRTGTRSYDRTHAICRVGGRTIGDLMREAEAPEGGR